MGKFHSRTNKVYCELLSEKMNNETQDSLKSEEEKEEFSILLYKYKNRDMKFKQEFF